jgi:glycosyltransferase involved in cell wall biosynthesis
MTRPLNFLHLSTFYPPWSFGGDAVYLHRLAHALGDDGHHVDVVHCVDSYHLLHPADPPSMVSGHPNVHVHRLRSGLGWLSPLLTQQTGRPLLKTSALMRLLASRQYDVIHFHNISLLGPHVLALSSPESSPVKLYTAHEHWLICPTHVLWKFGRRVCERPDCLRCTIMARRPPQLWRYTGQLDRMTRHVHQFIAPSDFSVALHRERGFAPPMTCLPYFVDRTDSDWQDPPPRPHARPYFLFVGRLEAIKGLQTLIPLWQDVEGHDLLIAGTGEFEAALRAMAGSNPRIHFLGFVPQQQLGALYYHAEACIVPSLTYETFGIIVIEAFMRKTPVIARNLGALTEIVTQSRGGRLFDSDAELLQAIEAIGRSRDERNRLGEQGYDAFVRLWAREAHMRRYYELLDVTARRSLGHVPWGERSQC